MKEMKVMLLEIDLLNTCGEISQIGSLLGNWLFDWSNGGDDG